MSRRHLALSFVAVALLLGSCGGDSPEDTGAGESREVEVTAADFSFDTESISAEAGESIDIRLVNSDDAEHSFTIDDIVDVEAEGGEEATGSFTAPDETAEFYCRYHPDEMRGELTVGG